MKKLARTLLLSVLAIVSSIALFACEKKGAPAPQEYNVTVAAGEHFDASANPSKATAGTKVTVFVETEEFFVVESVKTNGGDCTKTAEGKYEFTMPEKDVTVNVTVKAADDVAEDDGLVWTRFTPQIAPAPEDEILYNEQKFAISFGDAPVNNSTTEKGMIYAEIFSTDQNVIPDAAISGAEAVNVVSGWQALDAEFTIDLTKVKEGTTTIVFKDTEHGRAISKTVIVVPYGEAVPGRVWKTTVKVDLSALRGDYENLRIWITDENYVYGSAYAQTQFTDFTADQDEFIYEITYVPEHTFTIAVGYEYYEESVQDTRYKNFDITNTVTGGSSQTGFNGITDGNKISFMADGASVTAEVKEAD